MNEPQSAALTLTTANILTEAFLFDPFFSWLFPGKSHKKICIEWWHFLTRHAAKNPKWILSVDAHDSTSSNMD